MFPWWRFVSANYWPLWLALAMMRLLVLFPYRWQLAVGKLLGRALIRLAGRRREVARINLEICFPELDGLARQQLLQDHFISLGISVVEIALCWWGRSERLQTMVEIQGQEYLDAALAKGKGVIICVGHFTDIELAVRLLSLQLPSLRVSFRRHNNPLMYEIQRRAHERIVDAIVANDNMRFLLKTLRSNHPLYYLPDQDYHGRLSTFVDFFGHPASTTTATTHICARTGAAVVPMLPQRLSDGRGYRLTFSPALTDFPGSNEVTDTRRLMAVLEKQIRQAPEQYLWVHRRFKSTASGESAPY